MRSLKRAPSALPPSVPPRCPACGSRYTSWRSGPDDCYCHACGTPFADAPELPYDLIIDEWHPTLGALQAAGEVLLVRLGSGFYGVYLLPEESLVAARLRSRRVAARLAAVLSAGK